MLGSARSLEKVRLFLDGFLFFVEGLLGEVLHLFLEVLFEQVELLFVVGLVCGLRVRISIFVHLSSVDLVSVDFEDLLQPKVKLFAQFWLQLLEALVELDLGLEVGLLPVSLGYLLVFFIAGLEANVLEVVAEALH